jgi:hypothetical protein
MLRHALCLFPQISYETTVGYLKRNEQLQRIADLKPGQVISTHSPIHRELDRLLEQMDIKVLFLVRDPRDVSVSLCYYITREPIFGERRTYMQSLPDDHARLMATITGIDTYDVVGERIYWPSIEVLFRSRLDWLDHPRACVVAFEDLVGPKGGGTSERQRASIQKIAKHVGLRLTARDVEHIARSIFSRRTSTFRRGQIGGWRQEMVSEHRSAFKTLAGSLLIDLGYEADLEW